MIAMSNTASFLFPARVRAEVLAQHSVLRELLHRALEATTLGLQRQGPGLEELARAARDLHHRFRVHLTFEERALVPILATEEVWGPERAQALIEEHERQRAEMDTLIEGIATGWDLERLALTLRSLAVDLLRDMQEEEEGRLSDAILQEPLLERSGAR
jgi:hypothetical protein